MLSVWSVMPSVTSCVECDAGALASHTTHVVTLGLWVICGKWGHVIGTLCAATAANDGVTACTLSSLLVMLLLLPLLLMLLLLPLLLMLLLLPLLLMLLPLMLLTQALAYYCLWC